MKKYLANVIMHVLNEYDNRKGCAFIMPKKTIDPIG